MNGNVLSFLSQLKQPAMSKKICFTLASKNPRFPYSICPISGLNDGQCALPFLKVKCVLPERNYQASYSFDGGVKCLPCDARKNERLRHSECRLIIDWHRTRLIQSSLSILGRFMCGNFPACWSHPPTIQGFYLLTLWQDRWEDWRQGRQFDCGCGRLRRKELCLTCWTAPCSQGSGYCCHSWDLLGLPAIMQQLHVMRWKCCPLRMSCSAC